MLDSALNAYDKIKEKNDRHITPMYRPKNWKSNEREVEKRNKRTNWLRKGGDYESVIFCAPRPNSSLKRAMEKEIKATPFKFKVVETAGKSIKSHLQKSNPFPNKKCGKKDCLICSTGGKGNCRTNNIVYTIKCNICGHKYTGETARNGYSRGVEHLTGLKNKSENSVLYRHMREVHSSENVQPDYTMSITSTHKTALDRQVKEAILIHGAPPANQINRRNEWGHARIVSSALTVQ